VPADRSWESLREASALCRGCELFKKGTQTVFGAGPKNATLFFVGEQPGDQEDKQGAPFVGPAGRMLDRALSDVGLDRDEVYLTNAVKHFKWKANGNRRQHVGPSKLEVRACSPWLEAEIEAVRPELIACLGATAVEALLGGDVKVMKNRGEIKESVYGSCLVTVHPSSLLRVEGEAERRAAYDLFVQDLRKGLAFLRRGA
jgi:DNA polymerase